MSSILIEVICSVKQEDDLCPFTCRPSLIIGGLAEADLVPDGLLTVSQEQEIKENYQEVWMDFPLLWMKGSSNFGISCTSP